VRQALAGTVAPLRIKAPRGAGTMLALPPGNGQSFAGCQTIR